MDKCLHCLMLREVRKHKVEVISFLDSDEKPAFCRACYQLERTAPKTAYMAHNRTSTVFFESREDAEKYAGQGGATLGIEVTEITIIPKGAVK